MFKKISGWLRKHKIASGVAALLISWQAYTQINYQYINEKEKEEIILITQDIDERSKITVQAVEELDFTTADKNLEKIKEELQSIKEIAPVNKEYLQKIDNLLKSIETLVKFEINEQIEDNIYELLNTEETKSTHTDEPYYTFNHSYGEGYKKLLTAAQKTNVKMIVTATQKAHSQIDPTLYPALKKLFRLKIENAILKKNASISKKPRIIEQITYIIENELGW